MKKTETQPRFPLKTKVFYDFGEVELHDHYVITVMNRGITVIPAYNDTLLQLARTHFKDRPFVYITHRKNSYAVDPSIYKLTTKIENLVGFAVVSDRPISTKTVPVEKLFFEKPFELFSTLEEGIAWADSLVEKAKKEQH